ncbi:hypothetical protein [Enterobacter asburiae]|uniref:hypothetical protein n=1 Tax=Enterobacter asburiae TaxID=61645 RepID=UPI002FD52EA3
MTDTLVLKIDTHGNSFEAYSGVSGSWNHPTFINQGFSIELDQEHCTSTSLSGLIQNFPSTTRTTQWTASAFNRKFNQRIDDVRMWYIQSLIELFPKLSRRLQSLAKVEDGWDGRDAKSMSFESFGQLRRFLFKSDLFADDIGLYLDDDGSLILSYTSHSHGLVDMTFLANKIIFCSDDSEFELSLDEAVEIVKKD